MDRRVIIRLGPTPIVQSSQRWGRGAGADPQGCYRVRTDYAPVPPSAPPSSNAVDRKSPFAEFAFREHGARSAQLRTIRRPDGNEPSIARDPAEVDMAVAVRRFLIERNAVESPRGPWPAVRRQGRRRWQARRIELDDRMQDGPLRPSLEREEVCSAIRRAWYGRCCS